MPSSICSGVTPEYASRSVFEPPSSRKSVPLTNTTSRSLAAFSSPPTPIVPRPPPRARPPPAAPPPPPPAPPPQGGRPRGGAGEAGLGQLALERAHHRV